MRVYPVALGIKCRACGGVNAKDGGTIPHICLACWNKFQRYGQYGQSGKSTGNINDDFAAWLAQQLLIDLKRLRRYGMMRRCEATANFQYGNAGHQCALSATTLREEHFVCTAHARATDVRFNDQFGRDTPYLRLQALLAELAARDELIVDVLRNALDSVLPSADDVRGILVRD